MSRCRPALVGLGLVIAAVLLATSSCGTEEQVAGEPTISVSPATTGTSAPGTTLPPILRAQPGWTLTAVPNGEIQGYDGPDGTPTATVSNRYYDIPTTLPVLDQSPGWLKVGTPYKPNGSSAWVKADDAQVSSTPWRIEIDLASTHLKLFEEGVQVLDAPIGIGTAGTPTATGDFFVTHIQKPPSAAYGPFVMVTSGHSNVIQTWEGFPDGILAIHGPIGSDAAIGTTGVAISNGCIRMHVEDQQRLAGVTPGSPVIIR